MEFTIDILDRFSWYGSWLLLVSSNGSWYDLDFLQFKFIEFIRFQKLIYFGHRIKLIIQPKITIYRLHSDKVFYNRIALGCSIYH